MPELLALFTAAQKREIIEDETGSAAEAIVSVLIETIPSDLADRLDDEWDAMLEAMKRSNEEGD